MQIYLLNLFNKILISLISKEISEQTIKLLISTLDVSLFLFFIFHFFFIFLFISHD